MTPAEIDLSNFTSDARALVAAAVADADRDNVAVTPLHVFVAALEGTSPTSDALRRAVGNVEHVVSEARAYVAGAIKGEKDHEMASLSSDSALRALVSPTNLKPRPDPRRPTRYAISSVGLIQTLLGSPAVEGILDRLGMDAADVWERVNGALREIARDAGRPVILDQSDAPVPMGHLWAVEYVVERPDGSQLAVSARCSMSAAAAVEAKGIASARDALIDRCRGVAASLGYLPGVQELQVWFDDEGRLMSNA